MRQKGKPDAIPQVGQDETVSQINARLQSLTLDLARLREKYKEGHPEVQKVQVQITQLEKDKKARVAQIEESLRAEYRQLRRREADLNAAIDTHKARAAEQSLKLTEVESLKKQADSAAGLYTVLLQKLNETNIAASIQNNNVRLLDRAVVPTHPVWPRKRQLAIVSLLAGLLLGAGFVLLRDALDNTIKDADDVERRLHVELLATIPRYTRDDTSLATEAYQNLRTALLFSRRGERGQVVLVTGAAPGEGKTTTLLNLGRLLAAAGESTVLIDCDLRRANLHLRLNVPREPGFTDFFVGPLELSGLIRSTRHKNLWVIPAGVLPPNPPALLARPELYDRPRPAAASLPVDPRGLTARRRRHRRPAPRPRGRLDRARGPAEPHRPWRRQAGAQLAAQGDPAGGGSRSQRRRHQDEGVLRLRLLWRQEERSQAGRSRPTAVRDAGSSGHAETRGGERWVDLLGGSPSPAACSPGPSGSTPGRGPDLAGERRLRAADLRGAAGRAEGIERALAQGRRGRAPFDRGGSAHG